MKKDLQRSSTILLSALLFFSISVTASAAQNKKTLKILIYNIKGLPLPFLKHSRHKEVGNRLAQLRKEGKGFDIVLLQEAFHRKAEKINEYAKFPYKAIGPDRKGLKFGGGLMVLSEFPIDNRAIHVYEEGVSWDKLTRKGLVKVDLKLPGATQPVVIMDTHMQAGPSKAPFTDVEETDAIRERQILEARGFLLEHTKPQDLIIFGGDFNFRQKASRQTDHYVQFVGSTGFKDAIDICMNSSTCKKGNLTGAVWTNSVDHIFFQEPSDGHASLRPVFVQTRFNGETDKVLSDHVARELHVELTW